ncbi:MULTISPECIES: response regulator transcription factor [Ralstonia]|uniref:response regulator transcription factor n=1 Tax=Ralstonia TaxID=48736 RepID=UPI0009B8AE2D|nr:LuxR C-terminal-related transcriptional regulator [Ralstonia pickettii]MBU6524976.1 LuxR C-terminal-related transcriptional regulator [Ralstonia sp. B265]NPT52796.1 hypothetical protein [Ralstonia sp. 3N]
MDGPHRCPGRRSGRQPGAATAGCRQKMGCGRSNSQIAERHISVETVKSHMRQLLVRMGARNRTELATIYQRSR